MWNWFSLFALVMAMASPLVAAAGELVIDVKEAGIARTDVQGVLDSSGTTASAVVTIAKIPVAASRHSPHCAVRRVTVAGIPVSGNTESECVRVCVRPPAGYETNAAFGMPATTSHAWSQAFNYEWFTDTKIACIHVKNWSSHQDAVATVTIGVCRAGAGCANSAPPAAPAPTQAPVVRDRASERPVGRRIPV